MRGKLLFIIGLSLCSQPVFSQGQMYHWPLEAPQALTSTFAEYRSNHFHAGIDLKTWGREGYGVCAIADGYVWRIKTSPWGYGKTLYIRLQDGRTAVYAHLSGYAPAIEKVVEAEQQRLERYSVDIYPDSLDLPVRSGQVVAFSGRTGSVHPHLHFELRDEKGQPLNPLCHGFAIEDDCPPQMTSVCITPLDWRSSVDGEHRRRTYPLRWNAASGGYDLSTTPHIEGRAGLALAVHDLANGAQNRLNVYRLALFVDDRPIFSSSYDYFSFADFYQIDVGIDFNLRREGRGIYHHLYLISGNDLPFYQPRSPDAGVLETGMLEAGLHRIRIRAEDIQGNASLAEFDLLLNDRPQVEAISLCARDSGLDVDVTANDPDGCVNRVEVEFSPDGGRSWTRRTATPLPGYGDLFRAQWLQPMAAAMMVRAWAEDDYGLRSYPRVSSQGTVADVRGEPQLSWQQTYLRDGVELVIRSDRPLASEPKVFLNPPGQKSQRVPVYQDGSRQYRGRAPLACGRDGQVVVSVTARDLGGHLGAAAFTFPVAFITRARGGRVGEPGGGIEAEFEAESVYEDFVARIEPRQLSSPPGLPMRSRAWALFPDDCPFDQPATVWMTVASGEENNQRIGLYRLGPGDTWRYVDRMITGSGRAVGGRVRSFSIFALLEDDIAPRIWRVRPADGSRLSQRRPFLSANIKDTGSGIGAEEDVIMQLDGHELISQYDPPFECVSCHPPQPLSSGQHLLEVFVRDRAGNLSSAVSRFTIVP